jgi:hypothetical protein
MYFYVIKYFWGIKKFTSAKKKRMKHGVLKDEGVSLSALFQKRNLS